MHNDSLVSTTGTLRLGNTVRRLAGLFVIVVTCGPLAAAAAERPLPSPSAIRTLVVQHLATLRDYQPGDLLSQSEVAPILDILREQGIAAADHESTFDAFLPESAYLVFEMRSKHGREFMRKVSHLPMVYDRLERLTWVSQGKTTLRKLTTSSDGVKQVEFLCSDKGAQEFEKLLAADPRGRNFHLPTGHIYTADQLLVHLEKLRKQALRAQAATAAGK